VSSPASLKAQQQTSSSTGNADPNAAAEQHQYDLVVNRTNTLLGTDDAADHIDSDGTLDGGNYAFPINNNDKSDAAFQRSLNTALGEVTDKQKQGEHGGLLPPTHRVGFSTSLHHDNNALHVDHFNGAKFPVGTLLHAIVDVGIGHLMGPNFAFSYAGESEASPFRRPVGRLSNHGADEGLLSDAVYSDGCEDGKERAMDDTGMHALQLAW
jgi:hypothetical protein